MADNANENTRVPTPSAKEAEASTKPKPKDAELNKGLNTEGDGPDATLRVAEKREDGTVVLEIGDGRVFVAQVEEGAEVRRGSYVKLKAKDVDEDGVPINPVVKK